MANYKKPDYKNLYPDISNEIVSFLKKSDRKMEYQEYDLKRERFVYDYRQQKAVFIPSREDSLERLMENYVQFEDKNENPENLVVYCIMVEKMHHCLGLLAEEEFKLIEALYFNDYSERDMANLLHISQTAIHKRKVKILDKLKKLMEK